MLGVNTTQAATYSADVTAGSAGSPILFLNTAETTVAPTGSTLWFVADTLNGGMPSGSVNASLIGAIQSGSSGLQLVGTASTPGNYPAISAFQGAFTGQIGNINTAVENSNIYAVLWNDANRDNIIGDAGDTFGTFKIGIAPRAVSGGIPIGNATWNITTRMHADQNLVVVPEPASLGAAFGLLCLAGIALRKKVRQ